MMLFKNIYTKLLFIGTVCLIVVTAGAQNLLKVNASEPGAAISPNMWGIFFEDINLGADGGIYAELIKNRSFEFTKPLMGWTVMQPKKAEGSLLVINSKDINAANPRFIRVTADHAAKGDFGLNNEGFRGMGIKKDLRYDFSVMCRKQSGDVKMLIELVDSTGKNLGGTIVEFAESSNEWQKVSASFKATATVLKAKFNIWFTGDGVVDLDMISLFPSDTWKQRPGGMRADMIQLLADMKPGFIRFPGGCIVEGIDLNNRYQWKKTIGPVAERQLIMNRWNVEFPQRAAPDYFQTFGLGFYEYFQLAEDIGAEPLPILNCGMACQFNTAEVVALNELDPYVQDALDLIAFANDDSTTEWGKVRARMGHPAPFNLKMMGVGNENWGPQYIERLKIFTKAIKDKYPDFKLVNSSGTAPSGERFDYLNSELRNMHADFIDEHYYRNPEWFFSNANRYDSYPRNNTKVFGGEYASHVENAKTPDRKNNWLAALSEAAFMTGLERNADVVQMASYAPLFAHVDGWQWTPDLIWVNNLQSYGTPDYFVQKLYSLNKGTHTLPITLNGALVSGKDSLYAAAALDRNTNEIIIKIVNASAIEKYHTLSLSGVKKLASKAKLTILHSNQMDGVNTFEQPFNIAPQESAIPVKRHDININVLPYSFNIIRIKIL